MLTGALRKLFALAEDYPELRGNHRIERFLLMDHLSP